MEMCSQLEVVAHKIENCAVDYDYEVVGQKIIVDKAFLYLLKG